jgi:hypothetical protein
MISDDCQKDIDALSASASTTPGAQTINDTTLVAAVTDMNAQNGLTATVPVSSPNDPSITQPNILSAPISNLFGNVTGSVIEAVAVLGGSSVYFRPSFLIANSPLANALLTHEALHNLGLNDAQVESALGLSSAQCAGGSDCISVKLQNDCFPPPQPVLLGGPQ